MPPPIDLISKSMDLYLCVLRYILNEKSISSPPLIKVSSNGVGCNFNNPVEQIAKSPTAGKISLTLKINCMGTA